MHGRPAIAVVVAGMAVAGIAAACAGGGEDGASTPTVPGGRSPLTPVFEATSSTTASPTTATTATPPAAPAAPVPSTTTTVALLQGARPAGSAAVSDPQGDVTLSVERPPPWADLVAATLTLDDAGFELRVRLAGGDAPETSDGDHTMNVASFFDTDGDGSVDHEVWLNLGPGGWGAGWFSPSGARYREDSGVAVVTDGDEVVARFPWSHLGEAVEFRWSLASEWGRYETLGTDLAARDDMPDDDRPASFPA